MADLFEAKPEELQTEWDSSMATLWRIDNLLKACANASLQKNHLAWFDYLQIIKREAIVKMRHVDEEQPCKRKCSRCDCIELFNKIRKDLIVFLRTRDAGLSLEIDRRLDEAEIVLRDFMDKKGMLLRDTKDAMTKFRGG